MAKDTTEKPNYSDSTHVIVKPVFKRDEEGNLVRDLEATDQAYVEMRDRFFTAQEATNAQVVDVLYKKAWDTEKPTGRRSSPTSALAMGILVTLGDMAPSAKKLEEMGERIDGLLSSDPNFIRVRRAGRLSGWHYKPRFKTEKDKEILKKIETVSAREEAKLAQGEDLTDVEIE